MSQCSSVAVPHDSQCDLWVTEVWEQKELEVTYPKSHGCSQPRGGTGSASPRHPPSLKMFFPLPLLGKGQSSGPAHRSPSALVPRAAEPGLPDPRVASAGLLCLLFQAWLAEVEGRLPARGEQRRQSGLYDAQPAPAVNNCAQARERYSIRAALPLGSAASLGLLILDGSLSTDPSASVMRACGSPTRSFWLHGGPFKMVLVASSGPPARLL